MICGKKESEPLDALCKLFPGAVGAIYNLYGSVYVRITEFGDHAATSAMCSILYFGSALTPNTFDPNATDALDLRMSFDIVSHSAMFNIDHSATSKNQEP